MDRKTKDKSVPADIEDPAKSNENKSGSESKIFVFPKTGTIERSRSSPLSYKRNYYKGNKEGFSCQKNGFQDQLKGFSKKGFTKIEKGTKQPQSMKNKFTPYIGKHKNNEQKVKRSASKPYLRIDTYQSSKLSIEIKKKPLLNIELKRNPNDDNKSEAKVQINLNTSLSKPEIKVEKPHNKITIPPRSNAIKASKINQSNSMMPKIQVGKSSRTAIKISRTNKDTSYSLGEKDKNLSQIECPLCHFGCSDQQNIVQHFIEHHNLNTDFENAFVLSRSIKSGLTVCSVCKESIKTDDFMKHCITCHMENMIKVLSHSNIFEISKYATEKIEEEENKEKLEEDGEEVKSVESDLSSVSSCYSSCSSSDEDNDSENSDDDLYMAFVSSTIDITGVSAPGKKENIIKQQEIEKPEPISVHEEEKTKQKTVNEPMKIEQYASSLISLEIFLKNNKAIEIMPTPKCRLCNKEYPSSVMLMKHCYERHRPHFTDSLLNALEFIYPGITFENTDDELLLIPELRLDLTLFPPAKILENPIVVDKIELPHFLASVLIEALSIDNNQKKRYLQYPKNYNNEVLLLGLPIPFPVKVNTEEDTTLFMFIDTPHCSGIEISYMFEEIVHKIMDMNVIALQADNIFEKGITDDELSSLANYYSLIVLRSEPVIENGLKSLSIYAVSSKWTEELEESINNEFEDLYYKNEMSKCTKCGQIYRFQNQGTCIDGSEHDVGDQISNASIFTDPISKM